MVSVPLWLTAVFRRILVSRVLGVLGGVGVSFFRQQAGKLHEVSAYGASPLISLRGAGVRSSWVAGFPEEKKGRGGGSG